MSKQDPNINTAADEVLDDEYFQRQLRALHYSDGASNLASAEQGPRRFATGMVNDDDVYDSRLGDFSSSASSTAASANGAAAAGRDASRRASAATIDPSASSDFGAGDGSEDYAAGDYGDGPDYGAYSEDYFDQHIDEQYPYRAYDESIAAQELAAYEENKLRTQDRIRAEHRIKQEAIRLKQEAEANAGPVSKLIPDGEKKEIAIRVDSSIEEKEQSRISLSRMIYSPDEIYADPFFFEPTELTDGPILEDIYKLLLEGKGGTSVYKYARECSKVDSIGPACVSYLQQHFPMGNANDQEQFNFIVLALFEKMKDGDICIDLRNLNGLFDTIVKWEDTRQEAATFNESQSVLESIEFLVASASGYCPRSVETIETLLKKSIAVGSAEEVNSPLVYDSGRLYLRRNFNYETFIADFIARNKSLVISDEHKAKLIQAINILFPKPTPATAAATSTTAATASAAAAAAAVAALAKPDTGAKASAAGAGAEEVEVNMQEVSAALSAQSKFTVISGGPGTGKTTTVLRILLLLICLDDKNRNIKLCAPTGKAAARMSESIAGQMSNPDTQAAVASMAAQFGLTVEQILGYIPNTAVTVHSLIKSVPHSASARFNQHNRLKCDVLVVDEVSMLDMALFAKLLSALEDDCKIIMLGDKDQLASVEAGAVLAELCSCLNSRDPNRVDEKVMSVITEATHYSKEDILKEKIAGYVALLSKSWRSKDVPEIGQLATLVNEATSDELETAEPILAGEINDYLRVHREMMFDTDKYRMSNPVRERMSRIKHEFDTAAKKAEVRGVTPPIVFEEYKHKEVSPADYCRDIAQKAVARGDASNYSAFLEELERNDFTVSTDPAKRAELFNLMDRFRILCSNHNGEFGDKSLNNAIEAEVKRHYLFNKGYYETGAFFPGQIVIITKNNKALNLVNGYVGFCAFDEADEIKDREDEAKAIAAGKVIEKKGAKPYKDRKLRVFLPIASDTDSEDGSGAFTVISTMLLTDYDSGYAMSIHKSQGSEYNKVSIVLSKNPNRVLTKELVYTGITRAKKKVELVSSWASLRYALSHSVERESGLSDRLANL